MSTTKNEKYCKASNKQTLPSLVVLSLVLIITGISFVRAETFGYGRTEESLSTSTTFYPSSSVAITGTPTSTNITYIKYDYDDLIINVSEASGSPGLDYRINFTSVSSFNDVLLRAVYLESSTNHEILFQIWNYENLVWDNHYELLDSPLLSSTVPIFISDAEDHVSNGIVQVRFYHPDNGNTNDKIAIDSVQLLKGVTAVTTNDHDSLSGRNSESNHPWAYPRTNPDNFITNAEETDSLFRSENATLARLNKNVTFQNVTADYGLFNYLGSLINPIKKLFVKDIDVNGTIQLNLGNITNATSIDAKYFKLINIGNNPCTPLEAGAWCKNNTKTYYNASS